MMKLALSVCALCALTFAAGAEPSRLSKGQMDDVVAGAITTQHVNGGGNTPSGNANGVPTTNVNPAGSAPPGQNK